MKNTANTNTEVNIKYKYGWTTYDHPIRMATTGSTITAQQIDQLLASEAFANFVQPIKGNYTWILQGDTYDGYHIRTACGFKDSATCKTPKKALQDFFRRTPSWAEMMETK